MTYLFLSFDKADIVRQAVDIYGMLIGKRVEYAKTGSGAPVISDGYVSVSHKTLKGRQVGAVAFGDSSVGVDIEIVDDAVPYERIRDRFFRGNERIVATDRMSFYRVWTARECIGKRRGTGFFFGDSTDEEKVEYFVCGDVVVALSAESRPYIIFI